MRGPAARPWFDCRGKEPWWDRYLGEWNWFYIRTQVDDENECDLPRDVFDCLAAPLDESDTKTYSTRQDALDDLARAYRLARGEE